MIARKTPFQIDLQKLRTEFDDIRQRLPIHRVNQNYGGWAVTSQNGSYTDGWIKPAFDLAKKLKADLSQPEVTSLARSAGLTHPTKEYIVPTEACTPYMREILDIWFANGLKPHRVRYVLLMAGFATDWHQDAPDWQESTRLHLPIYTNSKCLFETHEEKIHMPADGTSFYVHVNQVHRATNFGTTDRIHLIASL